MSHLSGPFVSSEVETPGGGGRTMGISTSLDANGMREPRPPKYDAEELYGIIPQYVRAPYDVHEVNARTVDCSEFHEFKANSGSTVVCGFAYFWGIPVEILANNRSVDNTSAIQAPMRMSYAGVSLTHKT